MQQHHTQRFTAGSASPWLFIAAIAFFGLLLASPWAQAAGPEGNNLPQTPPPATPTAPATPDPHAGHNHAPGQHPAPTQSLTRAQHQAFAHAVDVSAFRELAVFHNGRVKILDTFAREQLRRIYGKTSFYDTQADTLDGPLKDRKSFKYPRVFTLLDLAFNPSYYTDKPLLHAEVLPLRRRLLAHLPPAEQERWLKIGRITPAMFLSPPMQAVYRGNQTSREEAKGRDQLFFAFSAWQNTASTLKLVAPNQPAGQWTHPNTAETQHTHIADLWSQLATAWRAGDAPAANTLLAKLNQLIPQENAAQYPTPFHRRLERVYNATGKFTLGYVFYAMATLALLLAMGTKRPWLRYAGVGLLFLGLGLHAASFAARTILSGRWAIHNQYESFIAISLFAVVVGVIMLITQRMLIFAAAAAALGTLSMLVANLWAIPSNEVGQVAGILATSRILYVHVNMVLVSYSLIGLAFFVSLGYLYSHYVSPQSPGHKKRLADLDQAQLTLMQLAFYLLGVGILLGAYWADHAWGRWWAWDPKETWALITWIVYLIAIHTRFGVRNRGLVTAWLSVIGFIVMLWTYWGVNLLLSGLHSYA